MEYNILLALFVKHFICDFPLQASPYQYLNKGTYGHFGGILHSLIHMAGTLIVMSFFVTLPLAFLLSVVDFMAHYHIDYAKVNIGRRFNLRPDNSEWFWILLGVDQLLHALTYFFIVAVSLL